jgi:hypothetical protein
MCVLSVLTISDIGTREDGEGPARTRRRGMAVRMKRYQGLGDLLWESRPATTVQQMPKQCGVDRGAPPAPRRHDWSAGGNRCLYKEIVVKRSNFFFDRGDVHDQGIILLLLILNLFSSEILHAARRPNSHYILYSSRFNNNWASYSQPLPHGTIQQNK